MTKGNTSRGGGRKPAAAAGPSLLEWVAGGLGALLALAVAGFLTAQALSPQADEPPMLEARATATRAGNGIHVVEVSVANRSGQAAAAVQVQGELKQGSSAIETSTATLDFVPGHSQRKAGLIFTRDPRRHTLEVRVTGFAAP